MGGSGDRQAGQVLATGRTHAVDAQEVRERYRAALRRALSPDAAEPPGALVWADAGAELVVRPEAAGVACEDGLVLVTLPVASEQTGEAEVVVPFAVGTAGVDAGLFMATQTRPRGPEAIVDRWAEPLVAAAWDALVRLAVDVAGAAPPTGIAATADGLRVTA